MSVGALLSALALPPEAAVERRIPRKLLADEAAATAADRRLVQDGVDEVLWVAALKPSSVGVPAYADHEREYLEIAVVTARLRSAARAGRLMELVHRAVPYPLVLAMEDAENGVSLSLGHKRRSMTSGAGVVLESLEATAWFDPAAPSAEEAAFLSSLPLAAQSARDLLSVYQGWLDRVAALAAARLTGTFTLPRSPEAAAMRREALDQHARLSREMAALRARARRETQIARRVDLNLEIRRLSASLKELGAFL
jgi:hypothetical protein